MNSFINRAVMWSPPAYTLYPILLIVLLHAIFNGAWMAGLESAVMKEQAEFYMTLSLEQIAHIQVSEL